jgi:hypothetical protein
MQGGIVASIIRQKKIAKVEEITMDEPHASFLALVVLDEPHVGKLALVVLIDGSNHHNYQNSSSMCRASHLKLIDALRPSQA